MGARPEQIRPEQIKDAFGEVLRRLRYERALSQEAVAFESGLDRSYLSELENGRWAPTVVTIFRLAQALETSPGDLVAEVDRQLRGEETGS